MYTEVAYTRDARGAYIKGRPCQSTTLIDKPSQPVSRSPRCVGAVGGLFPCRLHYFRRSTSALLATITHVHSRMHGAKRMHYTCATTTWARIGWKMTLNCTRHGTGCERVAEITVAVREYYSTNLRSAVVYDAILD